MTSTTTETNIDKVTMKDLKAADPRWCTMCGDYSILVGLRKYFVKEQFQPKDTVNISGIGCSGRIPHYLNTYGFHTIHGRTIPGAMGVALTRPDLKLFLSSGDGDSLSIGGNHLIHGIVKNFNCVYLLFDNQIYGLTKCQTSPTTRQGVKTNTQPSGSWVEPINPVKFALGAGATFVASTADWLGGHFLDTIEKAFQHKGFSLVHIAQRCPKYNPAAWNFKESDWLTFITDENKGIPADLKMAKDATVANHDPSDLSKAFAWAEKVPDTLGLFYQVEKPVYDADIREKVSSTVQESRDDLLSPFSL